MSPEAADRQNLDFYAHPAGYTSSGAHRASFDALPGDVAALTEIVRGLLLHRHWAQAAGIALSEDRLREIHIRPVEQLLDCLLAHDSRPLAVARGFGERAVGVCRHFAVLLAAMLRANGVPARARCGFATYFFTGRGEDHWICEYWNAAKRRWTMVDAQLDEAHRARLKPDFDPLDVPRDRFVAAGDAWVQSRSGMTDPAAFGIFDLRGLWFVAGNLLRDLAAINNREMLPWDVWGAMFAADEMPDGARLALLDRIASATRSSDENFGEARTLYANDPRLGVPGTVFNGLMGRPETV